MAPPMFHFAIVGAQRGFSSSVLLVLDGAFVYWFNVVLVARLDLFHLQSCWCSTGLLFICLMSCWWLDSIYFLFGPVGARRDFCWFLLFVLWRSKPKKKSLWRKGRDLRRDPQHREMLEMKRVASAIRITSWARAALHHRKEKVSIICDVFCLLLTLSFSLTHAVCLVGRRASRVRLKMSLHRLPPRTLFAAASRSVDARRPSTNRTLWLPPVHQHPTSSAPSTACNSWRKAF